jgi:PAS domain S-box-containing protein
MTIGSNGPHESANSVVDSKGLRERAEERARAIGAPDLEALSPEEARCLLHELRVRQIELEMENEELRRSLDQLDLIVDSMPAYVAYADPDLNLLHANRPLAEWWGCSKEQVVGKNYKELAPPEGYEGNAPYFRQAVASRQTVMHERQQENATGQRLFARVTSVPHLDEQGKVQGLVVLVLDITAQRQAELELQTRQQQLDLIIDNVPAYVVYADADWKVVHCNRAYAGFWGYSKEQVIGRRVKDIASPEVYPEIEHYLKQIMASRQGVTYENEVVAADGQTYTMWRSYVPHLDEQGNVAGIVALILDVTEQRRAGEALQASEERYRVVVENMLEGLAVVDEDGLLTYVNDSLCTMTDRACDELLGHRTAMLLPPEGRERHLAWLARRRTGHSDTYETVLQRQDGSRFPVLVSASPILDSQGNYRGSVAVCTDISERVEAEERIRRRVGELSALNRIAHTVSTEAELPMALARAGEIIAELFAAHCVHILWSEGEEPGSHFHVAYEPASAKASPLQLDVSLDKLAFLGRLLPEGRSQVVADIRSVPVSDLERELLVHRHVQSVVFIPLVIGGVAVGLLWVARDQAGRVFTKDEAHLAETIGLDLAAAIDSARSSRQAQAAAVAEERHRLARDLHDSVTQVLFSASLVAETLPQSWQRNPERALQSLENLRRLTRGALAEMRTLLLELRPSAVIHTPLAELLAQLTEATATRGGLQAQLFIEPIPSLPENVHTSFYRIAQEALNNVAKHAQAKTVTVSLSATPVPDRAAGASSHQVRLVIQDDGVGFSAGVKQSHHLGIGIMQERAAAVGATLALESQPGYGTQMTLIWSNESGDGQ